jgi:uncharacterized protein (DUF427 family)
MADDKEAIRVEQSAKRVRGYVSGEEVFDTSTPLLVWEIPHYPTYYVPEGDVNGHLVGNGRSRESRRLGPGEFLDIKVGDDLIPDGALRYPQAPVGELQSAIRFDWDSIDEWLEEDEPIYMHPRNPYTRIDILRSSRHVRIEIDGTVVAESHQPTLLFETGLPTRYYLPLSDVKADLLVDSDTETHCPYKGTAGYFSVDVDGKFHEDVAWIYRTPLPESVKIAGLVAFFNEKVDLEVDGRRVEARN